MQEHVVEVIREMMKTQGVSIRQISAQIAKEHGGSALGYTQQIHRILNDSNYEPSFSTVEKILSALKFSMWQLSPNHHLNHLETRLETLSNEIADMKGTIDHLCRSMETIAKHLDSRTIDKRS